MGPTLPAKLNSSRGPKSQSLGLDGKAFSEAGAYIQEPPGQKDLWRVFVPPTGPGFQAFVPFGGEWWNAFHQNPRFLREWALKLWPCLS